MSLNIAQKFIEALHTLENDKNPEPLVTLYAEDAHVGNLIAPEKFLGPDGARHFWAEYRGTFQTVHSEFRNVLVGDGGAALEWVTKGTNFEGRAFQYAGVTVLEIKDSHVTRSWAYFDPASLGRQVV